MFRFRVIYGRRADDSHFLNAGRLPSERRVPLRLPIRDPLLNCLGAQAHH